MTYRTLIAAALANLAVSLIDYPLAFVNAASFFGCLLAIVVMAIADCVRHARRR